MLAEINWLDILFVILLLGMVYKGTKVGVAGQIISLIGGFAIVFVPITYYSVLSEAIFGFLLQRWAKPVSFFVILLGVFTLTKTAERFSNVIVGDEVSSLEKFAGGLIAGLRAMMFFGVVSMLLLLAPIEYTRLSVLEGSVASNAFMNMDAAIYSWMTAGLADEKKRTKKGVVKEFTDIAMSN